MTLRVAGVVLRIAASLAVLPSLLCVPWQHPALAEADSGKSFATREDAVAALIDALRRDDGRALRAVLGPDSDKLVNSGDHTADLAMRRKFLAAYDETHALVADGPDRAVLTIGPDAWPLPLPLVQTGGRWRFDTQRGIEELVDRRIGRNEIAAIRTALAYVDAQKLFFAMTQKDGHAEYARRLASTPGKQDGLYWPATADEPQSPLAPLVAQATEEGYPGARVGGRRMPYHGYYVRILTAQGNSAPGGAMDYLADGRMTKGFGLVAWPARYGISGVMTFIVNQDGVVFQKDLEERTEAVASTMTRFDPDLSWARVDVVGQ